MLFILGLPVLRMSRILKKAELNALGRSQHRTDSVSLKITRRPLGVTSSLIPRRFCRVTRIAG